jgi:hypothetical protein
MIKIVYIKEAKPTENIKNKLYYHGTDRQKYGERIIKDGVLKPDKDEGKVYLTPDILYAYIFSVGSTDFGKELDREKVLKDSKNATDLEKEPFGYIFVVDGEDLKDIYPDEDGISYILFYLYTNMKDEYIMKRLYRYQKNILLKLAKIYLTEYERKKIKELDPSYLYSCGKKLLGKLTDDMKLALINAGIGVVNKSQIKIIGYYKFNKKNINKQLKEDFSNFNELVEYIEL